MNVVPLNATSSAASQIADLAELQRTSAARTPSKPLTPSALRNASPELQRKEVAAQFEAILVRQLLKPTMTGMFGEDSGVAGSIYGDMLTDTLSTQLTRGTGLGLGRMLEQQLTPRGQPVPNASDDSSAPLSS